MFHILNCGVEIKEAMIIEVMNAIAYRSLKKSGLQRGYVKRSKLSKFSLSKGE